MYMKLFYISQSSNYEQKMLFIIVDESSQDLAKLQGFNYGFVYMYVIFLF